MKYEDLCTDPESELKRTCNSLEIEFVEEMLIRLNNGVHDLGGSPSKFNPARRSIRLDTEFETAFSSAEVVKMRSIVGRAAPISGYN